MIIFGGAADAAELLPCSKDEGKLDKTSQTVTDPALDFDFLVQASGVSELGGLQNSVHGNMSSWRASPCIVINAHCS